MLDVGQSVSGEQLQCHDVLECDGNTCVHSEYN